MTNPNMTNPHALRLKRINEKGLAVATKLADLMAGKEVDLSELGDLRGLDLIDMKEMRLRDFLKQINAARKRLPTSEFGHCTTCTSPFDDPTLNETPWIEHCLECSSNPPVAQ
jgi:RNA polymerase-binding transcription factor DksA